MCPLAEYSAIQEAANICMIGGPYIRSSPAGSPYIRGYPIQSCSLASPKLPHKAARKHAQSSGRKRGWSELCFAPWCENPYRRRKSTARASLVRHGSAETGEVLTVSDGTRRVWRDGTGSRIRTAHAELPNLQGARSRTLTPDLTAKRYKASQELPEWRWRVRWEESRRCGFARSLHR